MRINVSGLKRAVGETKHYELKEEIKQAEAADNELQIIEPIELTLDVTNGGTYLEAKGTIKTAVRLVCGRCLESFDYPLVTDFNEKYVAAEVFGDQDDQETDEECITFTGDYIDLKPEVMAGIQLAIPMRQVCRDDCRGLCAKCGINLNRDKCRCADEDIDPRMAVLQDLLKK